MAIRTRIRKRKPARRRFRRRDETSAAPAPAPGANGNASGGLAAAAPSAAAPAGAAPPTAAHGAPPTGSSPPTGVAPSAGAAAAPAAPAAAAPASPIRTALRTWPRKVAAAIAAALLASGTSYFIGADFWQGVEEKIGTADAPVQATVITDVDRFDSDVVHVPEFVVPADIEEVPPPPNGDSEEGRYAWAHGLGGVDASSSLMRVVVNGRQTGPVLLQGLRVRVDQRRPPLRGSLVSYLGLGAPQSVRYVEVDLATDPPTWRFIGQEGTAVDHFPLRVSSSETEVFDVQVLRVRGDVSWHLELEYTADGEQGVTRIDDGGTPFRTTEVDAAAQDFYAWQNGRWTQFER
jgi:hypothetical protein